jgi:hypothetical protein
MECQLASPCRFSLFGLSGWRTFLHGGVPSRFSFSSSRIPMPVSTWARRLRPGAFSAFGVGWIANSVEDGCRPGECVGWTHTNDLAQRDTLSNGSFHTSDKGARFLRPPSYRVPMVGGDIFGVFPGGQPFFIKGERFDPDCGDRGFLCRICYTRKVRERWVFHVPWRNVLMCRVIKSRHRRLQIVKGNGGGCSHLK